VTHTSSRRSSSRSCAICGRTPRRPWAAPIGELLLRSTAPGSPTSTSSPPNPRVSPSRRTLRNRRFARVRKLIEKSRIGGAALETTEIRDVNFWSPTAERVARTLCVSRQPQCAPIGRSRADALRRHPGFHRLPAPVPQQNSGRRHARRPCLCRTQPHSPRDRKNRSAKFRIAARYLRKLPKAAPCRMNSSPFAAERFVIPVKVEQKRRVQGRGPRRQSQRADRLRGAARNHRAEQRPGRLLDERTSRDPSRSAEMTRQIANPPKRFSRPPETLAETGAAICQGALWRRLHCVAVSLSGDGSGVGEDRLLLSPRTHPLLERNLKLKNAKIVPVSIERKATIANCDHRNRTPAVKRSP